MHSLWNDGHLKAIALTDVQTDQTLALQGRRPDWALGKLTTKAVSVKWAQRPVEDAEWEDWARGDQDWGFHADVGRRMSGNGISQSVNNRRQPNLYLPLS